MESSQAPEEVAKDCFRKEKSMLKFLGISLSGNESLFYKIYSFTFLFVTNYTYPFLQFSEVFRNHDFNVIIDILIYEFGVFIGFAKTMVILRNRIKFGKMLDKFGRQPFTANFKSENKTKAVLLQKCVRITHIQALGYWIGLALAQSSAAINILIKRIRSNDYRDWEFPYGPLTLLNVTYSPNYEISWFYQQFSLASVGFRFATIDILTAAVLVHISFQLKILQDDFNNILLSGYKKMMTKARKEHPRNTILLHSDIDGSKIPWKYLRDSLTESVKYHLAILDIAREMEEVFSFLLLTAFLGTLGMLCFVVYKASLFDFNDIRLIITLMEGLVAALQVLLICYWSDQVTQESRELGRAIYGSSFQGTDLRFQRCMVFVIRRTQSPIKLTAAKFTDIGLTTFSWILRSSYSMFMVLRKTKYV